MCINRAVTLDPASATVTTSILLKTSSTASTTMTAFAFLCLLLVPFSMAQSHSYENSNWGGSDNTNGKQDPHVCTMDQASCGCCLMQKNMHRLEMFFNNTINAMEDTLTKAKAVLTNVRASRSAFSVGLSTQTAFDCYGPFRDDTLVFYQHVFINMGNNYDPTTGVFTVPRSGVYSLALTVYGDAGAPANTLAACANLCVNGVVVAGPQEKNNNDQEDSASIVIVLLLNAGDMVTVHLPIGCFLCDDSSHYNTFSGFLVYAI